MLLLCIPHLIDFIFSFAVVGMAQDFVGSNNINLLTPSGQFGTRLMGGSDAASPRYIFTHPSPFARLLFPDVDDMVSDMCHFSRSFDMKYI